MINVRALLEKDLSHTIEGEFAVPVVLVSPQGLRITKAVSGKPLCGRVLWARKEINPETGEPATVPFPVVTLRESSLLQVPKTGENWFVQIPQGPSPDSPMEDYLLDTSSVVGSNKNLGLVNLPLVMAENEDHDGSA